jgi:hypothetical protein
LITLSELIGRRLWTRVKSRRRRVYDLRFEWHGDRPLCTHLVLGGRGLLERLDLWPRSAQALPCGAGLDIHGSEVTIAPPPTG